MDILFRTVDSDGKLALVILEVNKVMRFIMNCEHVI